MGKFDNAIEGLKAQIKMVKIAEKSGLKFEENVIEELKEAIKVLKKEGEK